MDALSTLQPSRDGADSAALKTFLLTIQSHMNALESLGEPRTRYGALLGTSIVKFLPTRLQREWSRDPANKPTDINKVLEFLQKEVEIAERLSSLKPEKTKPSQSPAQQSKQQPQPATASQLAIGAKSHPTPGNKTQFSQSKTRHPSATGTKPKYQLNNPCIFCETWQSWWQTWCPVPLKERRKIIAEKKRCSNCFGASHEVK